MPVGPGTENSDSGEGAFLRIQRRIRLKAGSGRYVWKRTERSSFQSENTIMGSVLSGERRQANRDVAADELPMPLAWFLMVLLVAVVAFAFDQRRRLLKAASLVVESQEQLALISSMSSFGFWSWDAASDTVWASQQSRRILALAENAPLTGATLLSTIHPDDRPGVLKAINLPSRPNTMEMELRVVGADSETRWITAKAASYCGPKGTVSRVAGYVVDDSQRKRSAADLLQLQEKLTHLSRVALLGELSGALAHELQQPLTAILCNANTAQLLTKKTKFNLEELQEILQEIVNDDKNAGQIIQRLRALLVRGEKQFDPVEVRVLLADVMVLARGTLRERNIQVNTRIDEEMPAVKGDRVELQQVLLNLVLNACEAMSDNPARDRRMEVVVDLADDSHAVRISVLDCGNGIDAEQLERVFDPFFTTKVGGLGLGLAISHSIITAHGGRLWATNRSDRGAAFHFTLPIHIQKPLGKESHERHSSNSLYSG
jgi:two-component system, LuxR family, sensor kinase FixL